MAASLSSWFEKVRQALVTAAFRAGAELFLISILILFLELACIRWFPAHVLFLTFFTNVVLLACFLGMTLGLLAAEQKRNWIRHTPALLGLALLAGYVIEGMMAQGFAEYLDVGSQDRPQVVFFGTEYNVNALDEFRIPIEVVAGFFFVIIALAFVGPGQELGRALNRMPHRVLAYTINIGGSVVGIALFSLFSYLHLSPFWWFLPVAAGLAYYLVPKPGNPKPLMEWVTPCALLAVILGVVGAFSGLMVFRDPQNGELYRHEFLWSPYYRIDYLQGGRVGLAPPRMINVNLIGHQAMRDRDYVSPEYALPYMLQRDSRDILKLDKKPLKDVLIIGAGSGNDVSRALEWGAEHIDAVEIDPVIQKLGELDHPMKPYQQRDRVSVYLDDGRNFLRNGDKQYDLIIYALVDSLVLHSSHSNIRLESYLFTKQAFEDIKKRLKPGGAFVTYNYFRQGWIVARLAEGLNTVFKEEGDPDPSNALVFTYPYQARVIPDPTAEEPAFQGFGVVFAEKQAETAAESYVLRRAFLPSDKPGTVREWWLRQGVPTPDSPNGFLVPPETERQKLAAEAEVKRAYQPEGWWRFAPAKIEPPRGELGIATDNWPFLYVRSPMLPELSLRGMAVMGVIAVILILMFLPRRQQANGDATAVSVPAPKRSWGFDARMFFLGAGFMLVETKAVVHMALLFGSTWIVNSIVFFAVLVMILLANLFVIKVKPENLWPYYIGLFLTLLLNAFVPLDFFLGGDRVMQIVLSCLMVFAPIAFAGVIFATAFRKTSEPDRAFASNIAGAMLGGLAENTSMLIGFQFLVLVALGFYALSAVGAALGWVNTKAASEPSPSPAPNTPVEAG